MNFIEKCQQAYYSGKPLISDAQYDELIRIGKAEKTIGPKGDFKHAFPMWSLQKKYPGRGDTLPSNLNDYVETPKLDGSAVAITYTQVGGGILALSTFATRGDGKYGKLINSVKAEHLEIPLEIEGYESFIQVTGEVVATKNIPNARNIVSGAINLDSVAEFIERVEETGAVFVAYNIVDETGMFSESYSSDLHTLISLGFNVVTDRELAQQCPQDGIVYRLNNNSKFEEMGYTSKAPRAAFAVKEDADYVISTLKEVVWQVGKSGKVVPTAIIETVNIDGANVSRATLNNPSFIKEMGLFIGCKVKVIRAGEIIPQILGIYEE